MDHVLEPMLMDNVLESLYVLHGGADLNMMQDLEAAKQWIVELEVVVEKKHQAIKKMELLPSIPDFGSPDIVGV